jgi:membrane protease YdiL (CAAX protease family)
MKKNIRFYSTVVLVSLLILSLSTYFESPWSDIIYVSAFLFPLLYAESYAKRDRVKREEERGSAIAYRSYFEIDKRGVLLSLPTVVPAVLLIALGAYLTSLFMGWIGYSSNVNYDGSLFYMLLTLALLPAVLEEMLFRYLPMKLLLPYSARAAVVSSAVLFASFHLDILKIPYALIAGFIFITVDIMADSVIPSIVIHFTNNALSVVLMKYADTELSERVVYITLIPLLLVSLLFIIIGRKSYASAVKRALARGDEYKYDASIMLLPVLSVAVALLSL